MQVPTDVTFIGMSHSVAMEAAAQAWVERLAKVFDRIQHCTVSIALPHRHKRHGSRFQVRVTIAVPGHELAVTHEHPQDASHEDAYAALAGAFLAARRRLQGHAQSVRGHVRRPQLSRAMRA